MLDIKGLLYQASDWKRFGDAKEALKAIQEVALAKEDDVAALSELSTKFEGARKVCFQHTHTHTHTHTRKCMKYSVRHELESFSLHGIRHTLSPPPFPSLIQGSCTVPSQPTCLHTNETQLLNIACSK